MTNLINKIICLLIVLGTAISVSAAPEAEFKKLIKSWTLNTDGSQEFHYNMELTIYSYLAMVRLSRLQIMLSWKFFLVLQQTLRPIIT